VHLEYRLCREGEIISQGPLNTFFSSDDLQKCALISIPSVVTLGAYSICQECPVRSYSLVSDVTEATTCNYCGSNASIASCGANVLNVKQGEQESFDILVCFNLITLPRTDMPLLSI